VNVIMGAIIGYALGKLIFWSCPPAATASRPTVQAYGEEWIMSQHVKAWAAVTTFGLLLMELGAVWRWPHVGPQVATWLVTSGVLVWMLVTVPLTALSLLLLGAGMPGERGRHEAA